VEFNQPPARIASTEFRPIFVFDHSANLDPATVVSFGHEWEAFHRFDEAEMRKLGEMYFDIVTPEMLNASSQVLDVGCGSGRFIWWLKDRVRTITGLDPSDAIFAASRLIGRDEKVTLVQSSASNIPFADGAFDFVYSIGVLHHVPDPAAAMRDCIGKLKRGGYFLAFLYYALDNRGPAFKALFHASNALRRVVSALPQAVKRVVCDVLAVAVYLPLVLLCRLLKRAGVPVRLRQKVPLFAYEERSFYVIRNDALDRFGTPLERRFSRRQIQSMMEEAGLQDVRFSEGLPFWHAVGRKK
jgi:ubiquinone/menaquinone biosynthesis C-methylase UbiE